MKFSICLAFCLAFAIVCAQQDFGNEKDWAPVCQRCAREERRCEGMPTTSQEREFEQRYMDNYNKCMEKAKFGYLNVETSGQRRKRDVKVNGRYESSSARENCWNNVHNVCTDCGVLYVPPNKVAEYRRAVDRCANEAYDSSMDWPPVCQDCAQQAEQCEQMPATRQEKDYEKVFMDNYNQCMADADFGYLNIGYGNHDGRRKRGARIKRQSQSARETCWDNLHNACTDCGAFYVPQNKVAEYRRAVDTCVNQAYTASYST